MERIDESLPMFRRVFAVDNNWSELLRRLPATGLLSDDQRLIEVIVKRPKK